MKSWLQKLFICAAVIVAVVIFYSIYHAFSKIDQLYKLMSETDETQGTKQYKKSVDSQMTSMYKLHGGGMPLFCTFDLQKSDGTRNFGMLHTDGISRTAVTNSFQSPDDNYSIGMRLLNDQIYTWSSLSAQGSRVSLDSVVQPEGPAATLPPEVAAQWDVEQSYSCMPWVVDEQVFTLPKDIEFVDATAAMEAAKASMSCETCATFSGQDRDRCREWLSCGIE